MPKTFHKTKPNISLSDFLARAKTIKKFNSTGGKRYLVTKVDGDIMHFNRLDANEEINWTMNLKNVYKAYRELEDFATINFKPFVPITHSPARGLLLHLRMLELSA